MRRAIFIIPFLILISQICLAEEPVNLHEALFYEKLKGKKVRCHLCPRECTILEGRRGECGVRENKEGTLYTISYNRPCSIAIDPIEKKPFFHVLPGTKAFSIATAGCNLRCKHCQNYHIAMASPEAVDVTYWLPGGKLTYAPCWAKPKDAGYLTPQRLVELVKKAGCESIAYTYTEPTIFYEYMLDTAKLAQKAGIKNVMHSAGFINPEPLKALCPYLDAADIDLKAFTQDFYTKITEGEIETVKESIKILEREGVWLEITNLIIPTLNDKPEEIRKMCEWIKENVGTSVPIHFSRFWPMYKLTRLNPTPIETLEKAREIARKVGLEYVYLGNVPRGHKGENTYCPKCGKLLIERIGYTVLKNNIEKRRCKFCGHIIPGIWE